MARQEFSGSAVPAKLAGSITDSDNTISIDDASGWPTGTNPFVVTIGRGTTAEETILCSGRTGTTLTVSTRGYDGTTAQAHSSGDDIEHTISASIFEDLSDHVYDTGRDSHTQYLNGTRHDARDHSTALGTASVSDLADVAGSPDDGDILIWSADDSEYQPGPLPTTGPTVQAGRHSILSTGGDTVTFPEEFSDSNVSVVVTPYQAGTGYIPIVSNVTASGFGVALINHSGTAVTGSVNWVAVSRTDT